jgi:hypothetical protein
MDVLPLVLALGIPAVAIVRQGLIVLQEADDGVVAHECGDPTEGERGGLTLGHPCRVEALR